MRGKELRLIKAIAENAGVDLQTYDGDERPPYKILEAIADRMGVHHSVRTHERYAIKRLPSYF